MNESFKKIKLFKDNFLEFIYKYRFIIALVIFVLCVFFEISGSSIGFWNEYVNLGKEDTEIIYGESRSNRSDEWAVLTPMVFSQYYNNFKWFNNLIRAEDTDIFMVYALPTMNLMQIFRPFQIGYLFLGISRGLSFFWMGRLIALFLVSFEFAMLLTKKNKSLSFIYGVMITLSPLVEWWFAVNGIAEIIIFGELALIVLYKYMNTDNFKKRLLYLLSAIVCAGGYILTLYPAWQVPMFYVFLILALWIIIENKNNLKIKTKDVISIVVSILIFIFCMIYIFSRSADTIKAVTGTVYPGSRMETGKDGIEFYFKYPMNIFITVKDVLLKHDQSTTAVMFGLFPIGLILTCIHIFKNKRKSDLLLILSLALYILFSIYSIFGLPELICKILFLGNTSSIRILFAVRFLRHFTIS